MYNYSPDYGINWNKKRWAIFRKYGYICQRCRIYSKGNLHLHHIVPIGCGGDNSEHNLVPLCKECHEFVHSGLYKGHLLKLRKRI